MMAISVQNCQLVHTETLMFWRICT